MHTERRPGHRTFWARCHQVLHIVTITTVWMALTCTACDAPSRKKIRNFMTLETWLCFIPTLLRHSAVGPRSPHDVCSPVIHHLKCKLNSNHNFYQAVWCGCIQCSIKLPVSVFTQRYTANTTLSLTTAHWHWMIFVKAPRLAVHTAVMPRAQRRCVNRQAVPACQRNRLTSSWRVKGQVGQVKWLMTVSYFSWTAWPCRRR